MAGLISIIIPVYNVEQYIERCIDSVLLQTYKNLEIILIDDGSTDKSSKICDEYAKKDSRIKVIHKENGGVSSARNAGLDVATGEYIGFVDSDDYIDSNMYECLINSITNNKCDIVICGFHEVFGGVIKDVAICESETSISVREGIIKLIEDDTYKGYLWNRLYKRELFDGVKFPEMIVLEDMYVNHLVFEKSKKIHLLDKTLYSYIRRENSVTLKRRTKAEVTIFRYHMDSYNRLIDDFREMGSLLDYRRILAAFNMLLNIDANKLYDEYQKVYEDAYSFLENNPELLENEMIAPGKKIKIKLYLTNKKIFFLLNRLYNLLVYKKNTFECL